MGVLDIWILLYIPCSVYIIKPTYRVCKMKKTQPQSNCHYNFFLVSILFSSLQMKLTLNLKVENSMYEFVIYLRNFFFINHFS